MARTLFTTEAFLCGDTRRDFLFAIMCHTIICTDSSYEMQGSAFHSGWSNISGQYRAVTSSVVKYYVIGADTARV